VFGFTGRIAAVFNQADPQLSGIPRPAVHLADLNFLHPFPEGNGRLQRLFLKELGLRAGFQAQIKGMTAKEWVGASIESAQEPPMGPHRQMTELIGRQSRALSPEMKRALNALERSQGARVRSLEAKERGELGD